MLLLLGRKEDGGVELVATGAWIAPNAAELEQLVQGTAIGSVASGARTINMRGLEKIDTYGALLLQRLLQAWEARGQPMRVVDVDDRFQGLLRDVHGLTTPPAGKPAPDPRGI